MANNRNYGVKDVEMLMAARTRGGKWSLQFKVYDLES
jgi:hypothetical protein